MEDTKQKLQLPFAHNAIITVSQPQIACSDLIIAQEPDSCLAVGH